jgi:hypothetical protein
MSTKDNVLRRAKRIPKGLPVYMSHRATPQARLRDLLQSLSPTEALDARLFLVIHLCRQMNRGLTVHGLAGNLSAQKLLDNLRKFGHRSSLNDLVLWAIFGSAHELRESLSRISRGVEPGLLQVDLPAGFDPTPAPSDAWSLWDDL